MIKFAKLDAICGNNKIKIKIAYTFLFFNVLLSKYVCLRMLIVDLHAVFVV